MAEVLGCKRHILPPDRGARQGCAAKFFGSIAGLVALYVLVLTGFGLVLWQVLENQTQQHVVGWGIAALFVAPTLLISFRSIFLHTRHYVTPNLQKYYIRVLLFVPIYSLESWLALRFIPSAPYFEMLREIYEGYTIYSLFRLLTVFLGGREGVLRVFAAEGAPTTVSMRPFCCLRPWKLDETFYNRTSAMIVTYAVVRFIVAIVKISLEAAHALHDATWRVWSPWMWLALAVNFSQISAMYVAWRCDAT